MCHCQTTKSNRLICTNLNWATAFVIIIATSLIHCTPLFENSASQNILSNHIETNATPDYRLDERSTLLFLDADALNKLNGHDENHIDAHYYNGQQNDWLSHWTPRKQEFSISSLLESVFEAVTGGFNSIVDNVLGNDSKSSRVVITRANYKGHQLLRIHPNSDSDMDELLEMRESESEDIKFWTQSLNNKSMDFVVAPDIVNDVEDFLHERNIKFQVLISDLQKIIASQNPKMSKEQRDDLVTSQGHPMTWKRYHRFNEIMRYLDYLALNYPSLVELETIGHSYGGLPLKVAKISSGKSKSGEVKPTIWIDAGIHAREWISIAVATYILNQLVERNSSYTKLLEKTDWMIFPIANPDGYEFTHTGDRLWRKTRSNHADSSDARYTPTGLLHLVSHYTKWFWERCEGVDPNRNFDYYWGEDKNKRSSVSSDPCHETYEGPKAFSEPETRAMADYIMAHRDNIKLYLTLHSYNQMWLIPWGHTHKKPSDYAELANAAKKAARAISKVHGTPYKVGCSSDLLYPTTGASDDWAKGVAGIKYSYTMELRDRGTYGFLLPASQIIPTARETWAGIRAIARLVASRS